VYELVSGECLASVTFSKPVTALAVDRAESFLVAAANNGDLFRISLHEKVGVLMSLMIIVSYVTLDFQCF
jgi:hypothetical protein